MPKKHPFGPDASQLVPQRSLQEAREAGSCHSLISLL